MIHAVDRQKAVREVTVEQLECPALPQKIDCAIVIFLTVESITPSHNFCMPGSYLIHSFFHRHIPQAPDAYDFPGLIPVYEPIAGGADPVWTRTSEPRLKPPTKMLWSQTT
jgi:hypothetical protein